MTNGTNKAYGTLADLGQFRAHKEKFVLGTLDI